MESYLLGEIRFETVEMTKKIKVPFNGLWGNISLTREQSQNQKRWQFLQMSLCWSTMLCKNTYLLSIRIILVQWAMRGKWDKGIADLCLPHFLEPMSIHWIDTGWIPTSYTCEWWEFTIYSLSKYMVHMAPI